MRKEAESSAVDSKSIRDAICNAGAGAAAGAIAATFVCPLDVIKTRLQVLGLPETQRGSVIVTSLGNILKKEGVRGMFRGLSPTIIALLPNWAVYFSVYGKLKDLLQSNGIYILLNASQFFFLSFFLIFFNVVNILVIDGNLSIGANMVAAAGAGASTSIATNPLWVVKTRLMMLTVLIISSEADLMFRPFQPLPSG
ncbi:unnamed protein product [Eruca vesicaria subsp. sativa]|uniref:Uncharacterized protein n=1 Tax=Eruca vesicaria subsp. sativa TaxID=29727 RepID=A0ABC8KN61_ERUVS|nr:unnamed protein product [Eruca vesicaria subsp. sativa]